MVLQKQNEAPLRSLLFQLSDVERIEQSVGWNSGQQSTSFHTLMVFKYGKGTLRLNENIFQVAPDKCYSIAPGTSFQIENGYDNAIRLYRISFVVIQMRNKHPHTYTGAIFPGREEILSFPFSRLIRLVESLHMEQIKEDDLEWFQRQLRFQELMGFLLEHNLHFEHSTSLTQAVEYTIQYLRNNYMHNITVKQLAQLANISQWRYTSIFQELTGKKPLHFLTEVRINHSKQLLLNSKEPLREIASQVGFTDEYYFNRRFRQISGVTPKQYARTMSRSTRVRDWTGHEVEIPAQPKRIIYYGETFGDLLALGVKAVGSGFLSDKHALFEQLTHNVQDVGFPLSLDKTMKLKPDLIIFASADERQYSQVSRIAPTVTFNSFAPLTERLQTLGNWLGRKREAEQWLEDYHVKAAAMWQQLRIYIKPQETASVFITGHGKRWFVMGTSGLSSALYHPCGFQPVDKISEVLNAGQGFAEISPANLPEYAGDRIFMLLPAEGNARHTVEEMLSTALWRSLPAVKNGHVHMVEADQWNYSDALTREKLLEILPQLLRQSS
ncbi:AraC family transcriptional regulator [Paenibacillus sp. HWE-109]|uniref:AraC family transcriptional regulator n=1 Tax=Paenibacillus sp. HWE-109 TaxID=1306526 RepID=UPI001EDF9BE1|nr:AraC family transcriptional regulator [Paenibacillus sp. HWE-109]UKS28434.1 AraC family transcriptional regulator [Paenibacillus sp. HWE-109]